MSGSRGWVVPGAASLSHHADMSYAHHGCQVALGLVVLYWWGVVQALACRTSDGRPPQAPQDLS